MGGVQAAACVLLVAIHVGCLPLNTRPIIGVADQSTGPFHQYGDTYILATYVKFLEQAGARVVPVRVNQPTEYYETLLSRINGVLFPGGGSNLTSSYLATAARIIYDIIVKANDAGDFFPLWGTCLGFELLTNLTARHNLLEHTDAENISMALDLKPAYKESRLLGNASPSIINTLTKEKVTPNFHQYGLMEKTFSTTSSLSDFYRVLSTNKDRRGKVFVSTMEAFKYPFYATQWHPEDINYGWNPNSDIDHTPEAILVTQYFANFFVNEARKSRHRFPDAASESAAVMENYKPLFITDGSFIELYIFNFTQSPVY
ncbi:gamma-glutamyl hydrolase A-like isoform X2 [Haliotis asinina]|uniref:gamma-glutamyl hydrolase A-like isoform X2 n=1 Tax=Haliotis asinina TaxID=109174 RepID=UPI0035321E4C